MRRNEKQKAIGRRKSVGHREQSTIDRRSIVDGRFRWVRIFPPFFTYTKRISPCAQKSLVGIKSPMAKFLFLLVFFYAYCVRWKLVPNNFMSAPFYSQYCMHLNDNFPHRCNDASYIFYECFVSLGEKTKKLFFRFHCGIRFFRLWNENTRLHHLNVHFTFFL